LEPQQLKGLNYCFYARIVQMQSNFDTLISVWDNVEIGELKWNINCETCKRHLAGSAQSSPWLAPVCAEPTEFMSWERIFAKSHLGRMNRTKTSHFPTYYIEQDSMVDMNLEDRDWLQTGCWIIF
jgi:hypothetical protein